MPHSSQTHIRFSEPNEIYSHDIIRDLRDLEREFRAGQIEVKWVAVLREQLENVVLFDPGIQHVRIAKELLAQSGTTFVGAGEVRRSSEDEYVWATVKSTSCKTDLDIGTDGPQGEARFALGERVKAAVLELLKQPQIQSRS